MQAGAVPRSARAALRRGFAASCRTGIPAARRGAGIVAACGLAIALATGVAHAEPRRFVIDPSHTFPSFEGDHLGISVWRGKFNRSAGTIVYDEVTGAGDVDVRIEADSIDFGEPVLNRWAKGAAFLDVAQWGQARYIGRFEGATGGVPARVVGELELHGVTRPLTLDIVKFKCIPHPLHKRTLCGADARGTFDRAAFGLDAGRAFGFDTNVQLRVQVEATVE